MAIKGILFDKDGTLFSFGDTWSVWADQVLAEMIPADADLRDKVAKASGYDPETRQFVPGAPIVAASVDEIIDVWRSYLPDVPVERMHEIAARNLNDLPLCPTTDLVAFFTHLRAEGLKVGVATNDYEEGARIQLKEVEASVAVDFICGFDSGFGAKPGPGMVLGFCEQLGLRPSEVAMVGDSTHDLAAGKAADAGLVVGVLTGASGRKDLAHLADVVLPSIAELPDYLSKLKDS